MGLTAVILASVFALLVIYDVYIVLTKGNDATISMVM